MAITWQQVKLHWDRVLYLDEINGFRDIVGNATSERRAELQDDLRNSEAIASGGPDELQDFHSFIDEEMIANDAIAELAHELSLLALMKKVEIRLTHVLRKKVPAYANRQKISFGDYRTAVGDAVYGTLPERVHFRELLLICNCIKHNGKVSKDLASSFPAWVEGREMTGLDTAYDRLRDNVIKFVYAYVSAIYAAHP